VSVLWCCGRVYIVCVCLHTYTPLAGLCTREGHLVLTYSATEVAPTLARRGGGPILKRTQQPMKLKRNLAMGHNGPGTKDYYAGEGQQQITDLNAVCSSCCLLRTTFLIG
jgi:hypothetical protein